MLAVQYVKHHKTQQIAQQSEAARQDHELRIAGRQERFQQDLAAKLGLDRAHAALRYANVGNEQWWQTSDAATILDTYKDAAMHADQDPQAAQALNTMGEYMSTHMGLDVDELTHAAAQTSWTTSSPIAYAAHLQKGEGLTLDPTNLATTPGFESFEQPFTGTANVEELMAGIRDCHLSQALTAAASPHTIEQVAALADTDVETVKARSNTHEADLAGERDNLDR